MASSSAAALRARIRSMESTRQITRAMELAASSRVHRTQVQARNARPYLEALSAVVRDMAAGGAASPYLTGREGNRGLYLVIAGDRGLAGGYNSNVLKLAQERMEGREAVVLPVGKKAGAFFRSRGIPVLGEESPDQMRAADCFDLARRVARGYLAGEYDRVELIHTRFDSALTQTPQAVQLLPLERGPGKKSELLCEPDPETVLDAVVPEYLGGILWSGLCESRAAEQAARRNAMDTATRNADELIDGLRLQYNRARQSAITQEITEIIAGT